MKKLIAMLLAVLMIASLTACGGEEENNEDLVITRGEVSQETEAAADSTEAAPVVEDGVFSFEAEGIALIPGEAFDASKLSAPTSTYEVPSCAIEGTDNVYNYGTFELTAYNDGTGEVIYSILLLDPNITTAEGLALGDDLAKVIELFGENYVQDGTAYTYFRGETMLSVIVQNDAVASIEYRMNVQ